MFKQNFSRYVLVGFLLIKFCCAQEVLLPSMAPIHVIKLLKPLLPRDPVIFEAGAYDGTDSALLSRVWPDATIYSFEPVPELYARLVKNTERYKKIHTYQLALSNNNGFADFILSEHTKKPGEVFQSSSLLQPKEHLKRDHSVIFNKTISVKTVTIDSWAQENNVTKIDFMWLDLQGMELDVLKAAPKIMSTVRVVYIEVEFVEAYAKQALFEEVDEWLKTQGFKRIARDFKLPLNKRCWFGNCVYVR